MEISIPYGKGHLTLDTGGMPHVEVLRSDAGAIAPPKNETRIVEEAMANPIGTPVLEELARDRQNAVILCSDHTRPVPSRHIIPPMLKALRRGNPGIGITLLVATGFHRGSTREELAAKFGEEIVAAERIVVHDCTDDASLVSLGDLPSGAPLVINRLAAQADLLLAEGFIEPHFFAGFSGGRKSVLPGVCGRQTVLGNHCSAFIDSPCARTGVLKDNPIHRDMVAAAQMAKLAYIVNVIINGKKQVIAAFAGHFEQAHLAGCRHLEGLCQVQPQAPADIVVTSNGGAPLDQNIYQAVKGLTAAEAAAAEEAVLIMAAACADGAGGEGFYRALRDCASPAKLLEEILAVPMNSTLPDQWEAQILARILAKHRVILVCDEPVRPTAREMKLETADSLKEALAVAVKAKGSRARLAVIPDGVSVVVKPADSR